MVDTERQFRRSGDWGEKGKQGLCLFYLLYNGLNSDLIYMVRVLSLSKAKEIKLFSCRKSALRQINSKMVDVSLIEIAFGLLNVG